MYRIFYSPLLGTLVHTLFPTVLLLRENHYTLHHFQGGSARVTFLRAYSITMWMCVYESVSDERAARLALLVPRPGYGLENKYIHHYYCNLQSNVGWFYSLREPNCVFHAHTSAITEQIYKFLTPIIFIYHERTKSIQLTITRCKFVRFYI